MADILKDATKFIFDNAIALLSILATTILAIYSTQKNISLSNKLKLLEVKSNKQIQIESFNRELNGKTMFDLLDEWLDLLMDQENPRFRLKSDIESPDAVHYMTDFMRKTILFGSSETIALQALYMNFIYNGDNSTYGVDKLFVILTLNAAMIASLKRDFTGTECGIMELIEVKIKDAFMHEETITKLYKCMELQKYGLKLRI